MKFDTLVLNGRVVDGTGSPAYYGDVGILAGRISAIGNLKACTATTIIDATGKIVAPGHVTQHAHYDAALFWDPYCSNSGENGVTTIVNANCGFGFAPVKASDRERTMAMMETTEQIPVAHQRSAMPWNWETFPEYLDTVRSLPMGLNVMTYIPVNPLLVYVMGVDAAKTRAPTAAEMNEIHRLINEAMDAGAIGISMSTMGEQGNSHVDFDGTPMPTDCMSHETAVEIGRAVADRGEGIIQMLSQIAVFGDRAVTEKMAEMARGSGARVIHNIFLTSDLMPGMPDTDLAWLDGMRRRGLDVVAGTLPYRGWIETGVHDLDTAAGQLPAVRQIISCKSNEEILELISNPSFAADFADQYKTNGPASGAGGFEQQTVIDVGDVPELQVYIGKTLSQVSEMTGQGVVETMLDLGFRSKLSLQLKSAPIASSKPGEALQLMANSGVSVGVSDGGAHTKAFAHGHYGTDLLIWLVREEGLLSLEEMHFQLSLKVAQTLQIRDRGALALGFWADVLIYDLDTLHLDMTRFEIVHDMPEGDWRRNAVSGGYERIMVNGVTTHLKDRSTGDTPGQLLRTTSDRSRSVVAA